MLTRISSGTEKQNLDTVGSIPDISSLAARIGLPLVDEERSRTELAEKQRSIEETWARISAIPAGNRALRVLAKAGVDREKLIGYLWLIRLAHGKKRKNLANVPGVSLDTIKRLPKLLRQISRQVEAIEKHGYSLTADQMFALMLSPQLGGAYIIAKRLPAFLRSYARWISVWLSIRQNREMHDLDPSTEFKIQLVQLVLESSIDRKQHYGELAATMNVFYQVEGLKQKVTAGSLKVLWRRHPTLRKLPEPIKYSPVSPQMAEC